MTPIQIHTILVVDDDETILEVMEARLLSAGLAPLMADRAETALEMLAGEPVDLVVSDIRMPGMGGHGLLKEILEHWPHIPVILLTAHGTIPDAVGAIQAGAADYLTKPFDGKELVRRIRAVLESAAATVNDKDAAATGSGHAAASRTGSATAAGLLGGTAPTMVRFLTLLARVARSTAGVLLFGESGTGKELAARILHETGPRRHGPFVVVDCGSTQPTLLESELFGHVKGAFTHALKDKKGLVEEADGGTLFLDEIGNISPEMQTRLLRFLQEGTFRRVGETRERSATCRVVAATNADLPAKVRAGEFREDLYYRLKVVTLTIPPLRDRTEDIPELVSGLLSSLCQAQDRPVPLLAPAAMDRLTAHPWPGNVRELKHALEAALVFGADDVIREVDLQLDPVDNGCPAAGSALSLEASERQAIIRALESHGGIKKDAADALGISRRAIHYKIKKYGIGTNSD
jgi:DNA-binding NtrC family response regulator